MDQLHSTCRSSRLRPNSAAFGWVLLLLVLVPSAPCPALEELALGLRVAETGERARLEVLAAGPSSEVVPLRVGRMVSLLFPGRRLSRSTWEPLPALVASARIEEAGDGGRLLLELAPGAGGLEIEAREGRLILSLARGEEPASQFFRPVRVGGNEQPVRRSSGPSPAPAPAPDRAPPEQPGPAASPPPAPLPERAPPPGPPPAPATPAAPRPSPPAAPAPPEAAPPRTAARPADLLPGWGLAAPDIGLEMRLIPLRGRRGWDNLPEAIRTHYHPMVAAARVAADSPYIFRFRQRRDRFRVTLPSGRTVGSLDLRGREDLKFLSRGDAEALFDDLDLFPGSQGAGIALFPSTFALEEVERMEVMIRGDYHEMPPVSPGRE